MKLNLEDMERSTIECTVFPDTECFFCCLCNWAREEKEYCKDYYKALKESEYESFN